MGTWILAIAIVAVLTLVMKLLSPKKQLGKRCMSCPEQKYCGGNRPRCPRRSEMV